MATPQQAQQEIKRTGQLWTKGRRGCNACISVSVLHPDSYIPILATVESDHITQTQLERALSKVYPDLTFTISEDFGYLRAEGRKVQQ